MIRLATWPVANRIIGRPSRRLASFGGGLPMMRLSQRDVLYRIIGMPFVHFALFLHALYRILYVFSKQVWNFLFS